LLKSIELFSGIEKLVHMFLKDPQFMDESGIKDVKTETDSTEVSNRNFL
jgi:hypothetical protein